MSIDSYEKEFRFRIVKNYFLNYLIIPILFGMFIAFAFNQSLFPILFVIFIVLAANILGYLIAYKKVSFIYKNSVIRVLFKCGYFRKKNKEFEINLTEVKEYTERFIYRLCGNMQFIMKDSSIIEIPYSPHVETYVNLRSEILKVLEDNNIKRTCVFY